MTDQSTNIENSGPPGADENAMIEMDDVKGPGWFLKIAYLVISAVAVYYLFAYWNWKSGYDEQQAKIKIKIMQQNK